MRLNEVQSIGTIWKMYRLYLEAFPISERKPFSRILKKRNSSHTGRPGKLLKRLLERHERRKRREIYLRRNHSGREGTQKSANGSGTRRPNRKRTHRRGGSFPGSRRQTGSLRKQCIQGIQSKQQARRANVVIYGA